MNRQNQFLLSLLIFNLFTIASLFLFSQLYPSRILGATINSNESKQSKISNVNGLSQLFKYFSNKDDLQKNLNSLNLDIKKKQELEKLIPTITALSESINSGKGMVPCSILEPAVKQYCSTPSP